VNKIKIFVYGTLKRGHYNHGRCGLDGAGVSFIGQEYIDGYTLYRRYNLPYAVKEKGKRIKGEVYEVPFDVYDQIYWMEVGAGYYVEEVNGIRFFAHERYNMCMEIGEEFNN